MARGRVNWESVLDENAGVCVFVGLVDTHVRKVGQSASIRDRIAKGHLCYGFPQTESECNSRWEWPRCVVERDIVLLVFPMYKSVEVDRRYIEFGIQALDNPLIP
jgi:hypothetical protein